MMLYLAEMPQRGIQTKSCVIENRLPVFITQPCTLLVTYEVELKDDFYLIYLNVTGDLSVKCQRCLEQFTYFYNNQTTIAVCKNDERAEQLLEYYECIVSITSQVELEELIVDELHLYAPQFHPEINDCSSVINQYLIQKNESS